MLDAMFKSRIGHALIKYNTTLYVFGGNGPLKSAEFMEFTFEAWLPLRWDRLEDMIEAKSWLGAAE